MRPADPGALHFSDEFTNWTALSGIEIVFARKPRVPPIEARSARSIVSTLGCLNCIGPYRAESERRRKGIAAALQSRKQKKTAAALQSRKQKKTVTDDR